MSKGQTLRDLVVECLVAATDEIFELFDKTIREYEEQLQRKQRFLDLVLSPSLRLVRARHRPRFKLEISQTTMTDKELHKHGGDHSAGQKRPFEHIKETGKVGIDKSESGSEIQTENSDDDEDLHTSSRPTKCLKTETGGDHIKQVQVRRKNAVLKKSTMENNRVMLDTAGGECKKSLHRKKSKGAQRKKHQCPVCKEKFKYRVDLRAHNKIHAEESPLSCLTNQNICQSDRLDVHQRAHTKKKPYECPLCNKTFNTEALLDLHQLASHQREPQGSGMNRYQSVESMQTDLSKKNHLDVVKRHPNLLGRFDFGVCRQKSNKKCPNCE